MNEEVKNEISFAELPLPDGDSADGTLLTNVASELLERYSEAFRELAK